LRGCGIFDSVVFWHIGNLYDADNVLLAINHCLKLTSMYFYTEVVKILTFVILSNIVVLFGKPMAN
jgi:hypothetical protein